MVIIFSRIKKITQMPPQNIYELYSKKFIFISFFLNNIVNNILFFQVYPNIELLLWNIPQIIKHSLSYINIGNIFSKINI